MADTGATLCTSGSNLAGGGTAWTNPGNITADDASYAAAALAVSTSSKFLFASAFGFALAASDTIDGILVTIELQQDGTATGSCRDSEVYLYNSVGAQIGSNKAALSPFALNPPWTVRTYGGAADTWGAALTAATINSSAFGVGIKCAEYTGAGPCEGRIDYVKMTVYYTASSGAKIAQSRRAQVIEFTQPDEIFDPVGG